MERFPRKALKDADHLLTRNWTDYIYCRHVESHRCYHNLEHINKIWSYYNALYYKEAFDEKVLLATIFHDIVYDVGSKSNELASANQFTEWAYKSQYDFESFKEVHKVILATANHTNPDHDLPTWGKIFLDLDLYELGSPPEVYAENGQKIFDEFSSKFSKDEIVAGRIKWLESMVHSNNPIFRVFKNREKQARQNMGDELERLLTGAVLKITG